jgi:YHS domain-containing protein
MVEDPCCHVYIPVSEAYCGTLNGSDCYFCSRECYEKFKKERGMG